MLNNTAQLEWQAEVELVASWQEGWELMQAASQNATPNVNQNAAIGSGASAVGYRALALGIDGVAVKCECGLELNGRSAPGQADVEAEALYRDHARRCAQALPLAP